MTNTMTYDITIHNPDGTTTVRQLKAFWLGYDKKWHYSPRVEDHNALAILRGRRLPDGSAEYWTDNAKFTADTLEEVVRLYEQENPAPSVTLPVPPAPAPVSTVQNVDPDEILDLQRQTASINRLNKLLKFYGFPMTITSMRKRRNRGYIFSWKYEVGSNCCYSNVTDNRTDVLDFFGINPSSCLYFIGCIFSSIYYGTVFGNDACFVELKKNIIAWEKKWFRNQVRYCNSRDTDDFKEQCIMRWLRDKYPQYEFEDRLGGYQVFVKSNHHNTNEFLNRYKLLFVTPSFFGKYSDKDKVMSDLKKHIEDMKFGLNVWFQEVLARA